jgi:peptidoglycan/LPS O-acetylase OafA/YrhL
MRRIVVIEYMRGLAALAVTWFHLTNTYKDSLVAASGAYGWLGVDVFFVISGFIIPYSISKTYAVYSIRDFPNFVTRRLVRLEPPYVLSILLVIGLGYLSALAPGFRGEDPEYGLGRVAAHLLYLIPFSGHDWLQPVYWTLAYEFAFYLFIGVMFPLIGRQNRPLAWIALALTVGVAVLTGILPDRSLLFVLGFAVFKLLTPARPDCEGVERGMSIVIVCGAVFILFRGSVPTALIGLGAAAIIYAFAHLGGLRGMLGRILLGLGTISYSLYLVHVPVGGRVVNLGKRFVTEPSAELLLSTIALMVSLVVALLFYIFIERPTVRIAHRLRPKRGLARRAST